MSNNKMLIDATHPEETRVVVLRGGRVEEFDFESAARKLLRGNIYLAKVTRVEPSLQAAFVDYGGNRHGFLAFNEIHPDYYQIPVADRQALLEEEAAQEAAAEAEADAAAAADAERADAAGEELAVDVAELLPPEPAADDALPPAQMPAVSDEDVQRSEPVAAEPAADEAGEQGAAPAAARNGDEAPASGEGNIVETVDTAAAAEPEQVESVGNQDALEELPSRPRRRMRSYKIQEVIKRRQVILVQVVKEERGTKGAALTTYLSLAGRYTVLMPNTARGGGISRKITNAQDRKRLKAIADDLDVPDGMGLIIRTAGAARTKQEIKRDFEYLMRLWESVRDVTLQSTAPSLVYEEGNLIKRSIRDLYTKDVEEVIVAGNEAFREAKDFMRMLMPSHTKNVIQFAESEPLFTRFQIERQLNAMFSPYVYLRSGGYLVINQTEALVAIDVNSGKATREFSIEETALNTNTEAADEIARQLKLRDLAGLIVIDFIDMEEKRNNRHVERRLKDALRFDRARIQLGRISHFGLMEMSRQRLRTGVLEGSTSQCPHCQGTGIIRSTESVALAVIRGLEDALMSGQPSSLNATTTAGVALYILNNKRQFILDMEQRHSITVTVQASDKLQGANFTIERVATAAPVARRPERSAAVSMDWGFDGESAESDNEPPADDVVQEVEQAGEYDAEPREQEGGRSRRRRRRRGGRRDDNFERGARDSHRGEEAHFDRGAGEQPSVDDVGHSGNGHANGNGVAAAEAGEASFDAEQGDDGDESRADAASEGGQEAREGGDDDSAGRRGRRGRRRGRRGGRRGRDRQQESQGAAGGTAGENEDGNGQLDAGPGEAQSTDIGVDADPPRPVRAADDIVAEPSASAVTVAISHVEQVQSAPEPERPAEEASTEVPPVEPGVPVAPVIERLLVRPDAPVISEVTPLGPIDEALRPARKGWWQRRFSGE